MSLPFWLRWPEPTEPPSTLLKESREEMYRALSLYHDHVRHVIYIMLSVPGGLLLLIKFSGSAKFDWMLYLISGLVLVLVPPSISRLSKIVIRRYYEVYVSSLIFATRLHSLMVYKRSDENVHPWFDRTVIQARDQFKVQSADEFLKARADNKDDTFIGYCNILDFLAKANAVGGIALMSYGLVLEWVSCAGAIPWCGLAL